MGITIAFRFPLGRYHATPWDRSANEGEVEWPPSPWRLLRALIATWHLRWPELPEGEVEALLAALREPPWYRTPATGSGHSRHYMPSLKHRSDRSGETDLVLDPFVAVHPGDALLVHWPTGLPEGHRAALVKLAEMLPYLGRSESVCKASVVEEGVSPDPETWWRPSLAGEEGEVRLLVPTREATRNQLEVTPTQVRRARFTMPPGARWVDYTRPRSVPSPQASAPPRTVEAIRWRFVSKAPYAAVNGVLATDLLRSGVLRTLSRENVPAPPTLVGKDLDGSPMGGHTHAHWLWIPDEHGRLLDVCLWVPAGIPSDVAAAVVRHRRIAGPGDGVESGGRWSPAGFSPGDLHLVAAGRTPDVLREMSGPSRTWTSATPYLPTRHQKRRSADSFYEEEVARELRFRGIDGPAPRVRLRPEADIWVQRHRRYRLKASMSDRRPGAALALEFDAPVKGPLVLGALSHFGFGLFMPTPEP